MQKIFVALLIVVSGFSLKARENPDSLYSVWEDSTLPDSGRVSAYKVYIWNSYLFSRPDTAAVLAEALHRFAQTHTYPKASAIGYNLQGIAYTIQSDYPLALEYNEKSLAIYEELGDQKGVAAILSNIGIIYKNLGNYPRALEFLEKTMSLSEEVADRDRMAKTLNNIGTIHISLGNYLRALKYYERSLEINEELGNKKNTSACMGNIGRIYERQGDFSKAMEYHQKALAIEEELGDKTGIATILNNIGILYIDRDNYPLAVEYYEKSLAIKEETGDKNGIAMSFTGLGSIYSLQGNYSRAMEYYEQSMAIAEEIGDKYIIALSMNNMGNLYQKQGELTRAMSYCKKGLELAEEIGALDWQESACQCLYNIYKDLGKGNEALLYLERIRVIEDSLHTRETAKKLEQMEFARVMLQDSIAKAEEDRKVQEAHQTEVRKKNQTRNVLIGSTLLFILLAGGLYSRWRYIRRSRDLISREKDRSENLLLNILPVEIAAELKENGRAAARDFDMVSILFTDFKDFTETSAKLSAAELVQEINHCFEGFDAIVEKYGIEKIKTIGDAYMAAGGLPVPTDDSVKNTVLAAIEMQAFIADRKATNSAAGLPAFDMRVGIHTGPVVAGIVGVKKFQYDIWGDSVNTASRMESNGEIGKVNISQSTYELLKNEPIFVFESRGKIEVKGKGEVEMYFVSAKNM